jgi:4-hydroxybenzoate polyprenyltransferase
MKLLLTDMIALMRLNRPIGIFLVLWPAWWGIAFTVDKQIPWGLLVVFFFGDVLMRSAGCVINDIIDREYDKGVERTKGRPLASGKLSVKAAVVLLALLLLSSLVLLLQLNSTTIMLGVLALFPIVLYPFMKRITYWPQLFLGGTINWGVLMGWSAVHDSLSMTPLLIYAASIFWTLGYDTIYAHQDMKDDLLMGIKSTAIKLQEHTRRYLVGFYGAAILLLWAAGVAIDMGLLFYVFLILAMVQLLWQVYTVDLTVPQDCWRKFTSNQFFGVLVFLGSVLGALFRI